MEKLHLVQRDSAELLQGLDGTWFVLLAGAASCRSGDHVGRVEKQPFIPVTHSLPSELTSGKPSGGEHRSLITA